jgi:uncharacterized membrane protein
MQDVELKVNINIFRLLCVIWVLLLVGIAIPGYTLPAELKTLYGIITGSLLTIFTAFSKKVAEIPNVPPAQEEPTN